ncbi:hypothetical protein HA466_0170150 [Hirschfeldia incana]|nr:hypothetical protein HA466_0170150 [Hirschfeldia incana]
MGENNESSAVSSSPPSPPNGLLPGHAASVTRPLDAERWAKAEERTAELIACIQPNPPSEDRRNAVARYVRRLIIDCFPLLQVEIFTFGSVPLKTYLPDGDIDLTAFTTNQSLKDSWASLVRDMLEKEEKNVNAEFRVKEVQYIQAEVKLIKCLVENIVVDISFNQIGGLCTLCFLEEADLFINQNHLFKRSIILIKAWCYYESRILGAHHGLISTYALETLVLYIFHVFNNSFSGPLEVLYRFLEFFSKFDWQNFCISLWGPVPVSSLPDVTAEPPRKDVGELRKSEAFLKEFSRAYAVNPVAAQETQGHPFVAKHFNVIDPLRENNNLGRSVSKGNFFRIRSAFTLGAKKLSRLLECPEEKLIHEVNLFFMNTWERHGNGRRPDAPGNDLWLSRLGDPEPCLQADNVSNSSISKRNQNSARLGVLQGARSIPSRQKNGVTEVISKAAYQTQAQEVRSNQNASNVKLQHITKPEIMVNNLNGRHLFARTRSSPELTETYGEALLPSRRIRAPEAGKRQNNSTRADSIREENLESESLSSSIRNAADSSSVRHTPSPRSPDSTVDVSSAVNSYCDDLGSVSVNEDFSAAEEQGVQQEEHDFVNSMTYVAGQGFNGHFPFPINFSTGPHLPFQMTPAILASMGYGQRNVPGIVPSNLPFMETPWGTNVQFPQNFVAPPFAHYFPSGSHPMSEKPSKAGNEEMGSPESDHDHWYEQEKGTPSFRLENGGYGVHQANDKHYSSSAEHSFVPSSRKIRSTRVDDLENSHSPVRGSQIQSEERNAGSRSVSCASSVRSRTSSESSWDGSTTRGSKSARDKQNRKVVSGAASALYGKGKSVPEHSIQIEDDNRERIHVLSNEILTERDLDPRLNVASFQLQRHQIHGHELAQASGPESTVSLAPFILGHGMQRKEADSCGYTFVPTGPPVPFFAMLPVSNYQAGGNATSDTLASHLSVDEGVENHDPCKSFDSTGVRSYVEPREPKNDILIGDIMSHWQNLQYGRSCQSFQHPSVLYPPPVVVPPAYLQGRIPWDGPGRPLAYTNVANQLMTYGPRLVPVSPVSTRPPNIYPRYANETPRYRSGTGTYFPNPKISPRDQRPTSGMRRGSYGHDRNDHQSDREGNWNAGSKARGSGRGSHNNRNQVDSKPRQDRSDRHWVSSYKQHESSSFSSHHSQNGPIRSNNSQDAPGNVAYSVYRLPQGMKQNSVTSPEGQHNPPPSAMMFYPYDHNSVDEAPRHLNDGNHSAGGGGYEDQPRYRGAHMSSSSPDDPSSPRFPRGK